MRKVEYGNGKIARLEVTKYGTVNCLLNNSGAEDIKNDVLPWPDWFGKTNLSERIEKAIAIVAERDVISANLLRANRHLKFEVGRRLVDVNRPLVIGDLVTPYFVKRELPDILYKYQVEGIRWLNEQRACILADDMGLGKTVQVLFALQQKFIDGRGHPTVVLCPKSLVPVWVSEAIKWTPEFVVWSIDSARRLKRSEWLRAIKSSHIQVVNYDVMSEVVEWSSGTVFKTVVCDEAHRLRNIGSQASKSYRDLEWDNAWFVTGTPIERDAEDLAVLMSLLLPQRFASSDRHETPAALSSRSDPYILRRTKRDMLKELPDVHDVEISIPLSPGQRMSYRKIRQKYIKASGKNLALTIFGKLLSICDYDPESKESSKLDAVMQIIEKAIAEGDKIVIISTELAPLRRLHKRAFDIYGKSVSRILEGKLSIGERNDIVTAFQQETFPQILFASSRVAKEGITLTAANRLVFVNQWWNPSTNNQARDRIVRIGQKKVCYVYRLTTEDTVESRIVEILKTKGKLVEDIIERMVESPDAINSDSESVLDQIMN